MISVIGIELRKLAANRFTWIALLILLVFMYWGMSDVFSQYQLKSTRIPLLSHDPPPGITLEQWAEREAQSIASHEKAVAVLENKLTFPGALGAVMSDIQIFGGLLIIVLAVNTVTGEFRNGTIAQIIGRGTTRRRFVLGKIGAVSVMALAWIAVAAVFGFLLVSYYGSEVAPMTSGGVTGGILPVIAFTWLVLMLYALLGVFLGFVLRSGTMAVAAGILIFMFDWVFISFGIPGSGVALDAVRNYAPNFNVISVMNAISPSETEFTGGYLMQWGSAAFDKYNEPGMAFGVLSAYIIFFIGVSLYVMSWRELKVG